MTSSSTNSTNRGKLLDLPLITSTEKGGGGGGGVGRIFLGGVPGKGGVPLFSGGLQTQSETLG